MLFNFDSNFYWKLYSPNIIIFITSISEYEPSDVQSISTRSVHIWRVLVNTMHLSTYINISIPIYEYRTYENISESISAGVYFRAANHILVDGWLAARWGGPRTKARRRRASPGMIHSCADADSNVRRSTYAFTRNLCTLFVEEKCAHTGSRSEASEAPGAWNLNVPHELRVHERQANELAHASAIRFPRNLFSSAILMCEKSWAVSCIEWIPDSDFHRHVSPVVDVHTLLLFVLKNLHAAKQRLQIYHDCLRDEIQLVAFFSAN